MTLLQGGRSADGTPADVRFDPATGRITAVATRLEVEAGEEVHDCSGMVLLDAPVEPHAHLDKALSASLAPNPVGDLLGGVAAWRDVLQHRSGDELLSLARQALQELVTHGVTVVRTHVNLDVSTGLRPLEALLELREEAAGAGAVDLQIVALVSSPLTGDAGAPRRELLDAALTMGADVAGGAPHIDPSPDACAEVALDAADRHGTPVDLHTDETLDPAALSLPALAAGTARRGWSGVGVGDGGHRVTASHCVSLGMHTRSVQDDVAAQLAEAGVAVIVLPQTNLYLQARGVTTAPPRGLTAVRALLDAGVTVAAGGDNIRDPFNPMGRSDPFETASLMVTVAHLTPAQAWHSVGAAGRAVMGLEPVQVRVGSPAELVCIEGDDLSDAMARGGERRIVVHGGRVVATVTVERDLPGW